MTWTLVLGNWYLYKVVFSACLQNLPLLLMQDPWGYLYISMKSKLHLCRCRGHKICSSHSILILALVELICRRKIPLEVSLFRAFVWPCFEQPLSKGSIVFLYIRNIVFLYIRNTGVTDATKGSEVKKTKKSLGRYTECSKPLHCMHLLKPPTWSTHPQRL